jgi:hypothetical protein
MLNYSGKPPSASPPRRITGQSLARRHLSKWQRARIAADIIDGKADIADLTHGQIAVLCGVSLNYAYKVRSNGARHRPKRDLAQRLTQVWGLANPRQRIEFARAVGPEQVFDVITQVG